VLQHVVDLPRLQRLHEGQGPARRPLHHEPHLRHLRRQPRHLLAATRRTWPTACKPPALAEWIINLGEAAEYMFDHNIFQDNLVGVDFCEQMVKETNPGVWEKAEKARGAARRRSTATGRSATSCARSTRSRASSTARRSQMSRLTREMFCLMEGRHVHPSTLYPAASARWPRSRLFTDYLVRLMKYVEFMKKVVPMHDDLFDFFYEALPGYEKVGERRVLLGCWGAFRTRRSATSTYRHDEWGADVRHAGRDRRRQARHDDLVDINLGIRILLGSSYYDDWDDQKMFVTHDPLGNPVDRRHPWNQTRSRGRRSATSNGNYTWVMSPRWFDGRATSWRSTPAAGRWRGSGPRRSPASWTSATSRRPAQSVQINLPKTALGRDGIRVEDSAVEQRDRARTGRGRTSRRTPRPWRSSSSRRRWTEIRAGHTKTWESRSRCPTRRSAVGSTRRCAACCRTIS
jgi:hydrogenase large subunit